MNKVLAVIISILLMISSLLGVAYQRRLAEVRIQRAELQQAVNALEQAANERKVAAATLAARQRDNAAQARKLAEAQGALAAALKRNAVWAEADVPTEILNALAGRSNESKTDGK